MKDYITRIITTIAGICLGISIPVSFIVLDLKELSLPLNFANAIVVVGSQLIYPVSFLLFPILFGISSFLFIVVLEERNQSKRHGEYVTAILNGISDPVLVCNHFGTILDSNERFKSLFHESLVSKVSEIKDGLFTDLLAKNDIQEVTVKRGDENQIFLVKCSPLGKGDFRYVLAFTDITSLREQQSLIEQQKMRLNDAAKLSALGEMASGFAHEINNPLTIISGQLTLLSRDIKNPANDALRSQQRIDVAMKTVERISMIIQALRNLARDTKDAKFDVCSLRDIVDDVISLSKMKLSGKDIAFTCELNSLEERSIHGDRIQLSQVFVNLVNNAVDAIEVTPSAWIKLILEEEEHFYRFSVVDSGNGIGRELARKIFEPMFTTKPVGKGTGLGLSLSRTIVEKHKGVLEIDFEKPNTTFVVRLPKNS